MTTTRTGTRPALPGDHTHHTEDTHTMRTHTRAAIAAATALALALTAACASDDTDTTTAAAADTADSGASTTVTFDDGWAKATGTEMTGVFGTITNPGDTDLHLIGVESDLGGSAELHETVPGGSGMMMQEREDGFVIPAGGELVLEPGGNHIMLMELGRPITTGQQITLTLEFDGAEQDVTVSARDFQGGEEEYVGGGHGEMSGGTSHDG
ncbi:copper chaperone PCu(A)C [Dietzia kunjamensis]|uniref:copper chaperone PCu(A)C n=1 Tax=Dietzia kunjamensis TaxID=322509 RepID=UPI002097000A|nr:copper chaperone PCu(A)C [Dietzia kunjamensis]USX45472.1 copper chaperone PCu(A)C [Dietzia kunjamensis]